MIRTGVLTEQDVEEDDRLLADPSFTFVDVTSFAACGRRAS